MSRGPIGTRVEIKRVKDGRYKTFPSLHAASAHFLKSKTYAVTCLKRQKPMIDPFGNEWQIVRTWIPEPKQGYIAPPSEEKEEPKLNTFYEVTQIAAELIKKPPGKWTHEIPTADGDYELARYEETVRVKSGIDLVFFRTIDGVRSWHRGVWKKRAKELRRKDIIRGKERGTDEDSRIESREDQRRSVHRR